MKIKQRWNKNVKDWRFETLEENYLNKISAVIEKYFFNVTVQLATQITLIKLKKCQIDREFIKKIINQDWKKLKNMSKNEIDKMMILFFIFNVQLRILETRIMKFISHKRILIVENEIESQEQKSQKKKFKTSIIFQTEARERTRTRKRKSW